MKKKRISVENNQCFKQSEVGDFMLFERLLHSSIIFRHVIENMHDGVLTIDNSGIITTVNPAAEKILEMPKKNLLNSKFSDFFFNYPENDDFNQTILDAIYDASMSHHKICNFYTGKTLKSLFVTTSFLKIDIEAEVQSVGITVLFSDITELQELRDAAIALDKIKILNQKLERLSYLDELTGLANRRFFNDNCNREWYRAIREQKSLAFIMADIDYFKELNDNQGHQAGDDYLVLAARTMEKPLNSPCDLLSRYGGDEFIVIMPDAGINEARMIAEAMRREIYDLNIENAYSPWKRLTISLGVAAAKPPDGSHWNGLLKNVDEALYRAKKNGRNQVVEYI